MGLVAGVDAFGGVAGEEVAIELESADAFDDGEALFLGDAGIDGAFVDDDVALGDDFADGLAGFDEGCEVRTIIEVDGGGNGDDCSMSVVQTKPWLWMASWRSSSETSRVRSWPAMSAATREGFISKPMVVKRVEKRRARGSPT